MSITAVPRLFAAACTGGCWLLLLAWFASRLATDRWHIVQYAWWTPSWVYLLVASTLLLLAAISARVGFRRRKARSRRRSQMMAPIALGLAIAYFAIIECRVYRLPWRQPVAQAAAQSGGLRVLFWNPSTNPDAEVARTMNLVASDLVIVANPTWVKPFTEMAERFGPSWYLAANQFIVLSRNRVLRWGGTDLGLHGREQRATGSGVLSEAPTGKRDPGRACWLEIDTTAVLGRPVILWLLDLPSDESLSRVQTAEHAAEVLRRWSGTAIVPDGGGNPVSTQPMEGFPAPDVVIGDLNNPRGSASLGRLAPGFHNAFDDGGAGYAASFPRTFPLVHIDQILLTEGLRATDYRIIDPGVSRHRMQWARIVPK